MLGYQEDSALPEDYALDLEEGDLLEAAAAVDVPMEGVSAAAELSTPVPQMESLKEDEEQQEEEDPSDAWARFVEQRFGEKVDLGASSARSSSAAAAEGTADSAVPSWRRFVMPGNTGETCSLHVSLYSSTCGVQMKLTVCLKVRRDTLVAACNYCLLDSLLGSSPDVLVNGVVQTTSRQRLMRRPRDSPERRRALICLTSST